MIRKFEKRDTADVMRIWLDSNIKVHSFIDESWWRSCAPAVEEAVVSAEVYVYVDETDGTICGFTGLSGDYIEGLFVTEERRSEGTGKKLLDYVKNIKEQLTLSVYVENTRAADFYRREGFEVQGEAPDKNTGKMELSMVWRKDMGPERGKIQIRKYQDDDCAEIMKLFYDTVHTVNAVDYTEEQLDAWAPEDMDGEKWSRSLGEHLTVVAYDGDVITGFGDMDSSGYLDRLYVHRDYQRRGIASAICACLEASVGSDITTHASVTARPFFEKRGYRVIRKQQVERCGVMLENYVMVKRKKEVPV